LSAKLDFKAEVFSIADGCDKAFSSSW